MIHANQQPVLKHYVLPIVFYARLDVQAADKASAAKVLHALFDRYYSGVAEDGSFLPAAVDMNRFDFEASELQEVEEL